jgi:hypothetical protein
MSADLPRLQSAHTQAVRRAAYRVSDTFRPRFAILKADRNVATYTSFPVKAGWSLDTRTPMLAKDEILHATWYARVIATVAIDKEGGPTAVNGESSWLTTFEGFSLAAVTSHRVIGVVFEGESMIGRVSWQSDAGVVLWSLPLSRCTSVEIHPDGSTTAVTLVSSTPAGRVTMSTFRSAVPREGIFPPIATVDAAAIIQAARGKRLR